MNDCPFVTWIIKLILILNKSVYPILGIIIFIFIIVNCRANFQRCRTISTSRSVIIL